MYLRTLGGSYHSVSVEKVPGGYKMLDPNHSESPHYSSTAPIKLETEKSWKDYSYLVAITAKRNPAAKKQFDEHYEIQC